MIALATTVFAASLIGSVHCAGMCGGLVAFYAGTDGRGVRTAWLAHVAYSVGRLGAYTALGAGAGAIGAALDATGQALLGVQRVATAIAGVLIVLWGLASLLAALGVRLPRLGAPRGVPAIRRAIAAVAAAPPLARAGAVGILTGCLPCGWLYAFVVTAAATGSALGGAGLMTVFWAGTLPMMVGLGVGIHVLARPLQRHVPTACAVAMIVIGLLALDGRLRATHVHPLPAVTATPDPGSSGHLHGSR